MSAWLVTIEGSRGPEPQILYSDDGRRFVGHPETWKPVAIRKLPDCIISRVHAWTIADALEWSREHPDLT